jgi:hypothetical protein
VVEVVNGFFALQRPLLQLPEGTPGLEEVAAHVRPAKCEDDLRCQPGELLGLFPVCPVLFSEIRMGWPNIYLRLITIPCFRWLPIVDAYRTICIAPTPEARAVFEAIREFGSVA